MMFLFTTSNKIGARLIRWATGEKCSHFATAFDCENPDGKGIIFHSTLTQGVHLEWFGEWIKHNKIVFALKCSQSDLLSEEKVYQALLNGYYGKKYDWLGFVKFSFYAVRRKLSGRAIPQNIGDGSRNNYLCTEIAEGIKGVHPSLVPAHLPSSLITPYALYQIMSKSTDLRHVLVKTKNS